MYHNRLTIMRLAAFALTGLLILAVSSSVQAEQQSKGSVKVFILAGQSNMVGDGHIDPAEKKGTLAYMVRNSDKKDKFKHLVDKDGRWLVRDDVWYFQRQVLKKDWGQSQKVETIDVASGLKPGLQGRAGKLSGVRRRIKQVVEPAQFAVAKKMHNVTCVQTRDFFRMPEESPTGASYHWNSNAETYSLIGDSMGKAMKDLLHEKADRK